MTNLFIEQRHLKILIDIFQKFSTEIEVYAYGSRINGKAHEGSDLDLVVKNLPSNLKIFDLKEMISQSNIPFLVDINIYDNLPQSFKDEIEKNNIKIFPKNKI